MKKATNMEEGNEGWTVFMATGVKHSYTDVDVESQKVTCIVTYNGTTYMTVIVDVGTDTVQVEGDVDVLADKGADKASYIDMFKHQAGFFIENKITNPEQYYDELIAQLKE